MLAYVLTFCASAPTGVDPWLGWQRGHSNTISELLRLAFSRIVLCDRFAEHLKDPSQVTARKQVGALLGISGNQAELSLRIGEAQQI